ncbi:hypothetical protein GCM10027610_114320 [Dactylosporangium cerinum]
MATYGRTDDGAQCRARLAAGPGRVIDDAPRAARVDHGCSVVTVPGRWAWRLGWSVGLAAEDGSGWSGQPRVLSKG